LTKPLLPNTPSSRARTELPTNSGKHDGNDQEMLPPALGAGDDIGTEIQIRQTRVTSTAIRTVVSRIEV